MLEDVFCLEHSELDKVDHTLSEVGAGGVYWAFVSAVLVRRLA